MNKDTSNLTRYVESVSFDHRYLEKVDEDTLRESIAKLPQKLRESVKDTANEGWWVPISFYNKRNGNGRIYNKRLWENVINNQKETYCHAPMLCDHPSGDSDGNPKDICGVWLDCKLGPEGYDGVGLVYGLLIPSGRIGEDLKDHLSKGLRIGTSSSGFGKLMSDGETVNPDTFVIERLADWVLNPSQGTFFSYDESEDDVSDLSIRESINNSIETMQENNIKEKVVKDSKIAKLEEKKFRRDMESFLESANNIKDPQERLEEFREIKSYLEEGACPDLKERVEAKILEEENAIKFALQESAQMKEELGVESAADLKEKLTKIVEDTQILEQESRDWKKVSEKLQARYLETKKTLDARPTSEFVTSLKEKNKKLENSLKEQAEKAEAVVTELAESYRKIKEENAALQEKVQKLEEENKDLSTSLKEANAQFYYTAKADKLNEATYTKTRSSLAEANETVSKLETLVESQRIELEKALKDVNDYKVLSEKRKIQLQGLAKETKKIQDRILQERTKQEVVNKTPVECYYDSLYESFGNEIKPYERTIKRARSLQEAKNIFITKILQNLEESQEIEASRIPESLYVTPSQRANAINPMGFKKADAIDRMPKGWI